ncbi:hypothetical protein WA158_004205 [Blastocystis sp. Blastoise]
MPGDKDNNYIMCPGHIRPIVGLDFSDETPDGVFLLSASQDKTAMLRDGVTGDWIGSFLGHKGAVTCCRINKTGTIAVTGSSDYTCKVWDATKGNCLYTYEDKHIIRSVDINKSNTQISIAGRSNKLDIYNIYIPSSPLCSFQFPEDPRGVCKCIFNKVDEKYIYALHMNGILYCIDITTGKSSQSVNIPQLLYTHENQTFDEVLYIKEKYEIKDFVISQDNQLLFVLINKCLCILDNQLTMKHIYDLNFVPESVSISPDNTKLLLTASTYIYEYTLQDFQEIHIYKGHSGIVRVTQYHPNGKIFASASEDGCLRLWN